MISRMKKISVPALAILALVAASGATDALAFDHLEITVVNPHMVAGRPAVTVETDFSVNVRAVNGDGTTDLNADFIHAQLISPDVAAVLPGASYLSGGEFQFDNVRFLSDGQPTVGRIVDQTEIRSHVRRVNLVRKVIIHCIAIGDFQKNFMKSLARENGGVYVDLGK